MEMRVNLKTNYHWDVSTLELYIILLYVSSGIRNFPFLQIVFKIHING